MTLKAVELQVALPRTQDLGKMQELMNQKPSLQQEQLMVQAQAEEAHNRQRLVRRGEGKAIALRSDQHGGRQKSEAATSKNCGAEEVEPPAPHPYKGHRIDLSL